MPSSPGATSGISSLFHHIDLALATAHLAPGGPFTGNHVFTTDESGGPIGATSGCIVRITNDLVDWGFEVGFNGIVLGQDVSDDLYVPAMGSFSVYASTLGGLVIRTEGPYPLLHKTEYDLWDESVPGAVVVHALPGWEYDFYTIHL